jgi:mono/diheme cytochrome c family protein
MSTRRGVTRFGALAVSALIAACGGDSPDPDPADRTAQTQPPATQPAAGAPQQPAQATAGPLPPGVTQEMVEQGRQVYHGQGICFTCHGQNGQGTQLGPSLADGTWLWVTDEGNLLTELTTIIRTGVLQPKEYPAPMPAMGGVSLSDDQVNAVAAYVYSLNPSGG